MLLAAGQGLGRVGFGLVLVCFVPFVDSFLLQTAAVEWAAGVQGGGSELGFALEMLLRHWELPAPNQTHS